MIHVDGFHLLWRHVARRAENLSGAGHHGDFGFQRFGEPEIGDVDVVGFIDQDVLRLQVAVDDALVVGSFEGGAHLAGEFEGAVEGEASFVVDQAGKIAAFDEGHGDELDAADVAQIVYAEDVLLRDLAGQQELLFEALHGLRIGGQLGTDEFEGDGAAEFVVVGLVDGAHAAFAEQGLDAVAGAERGTRLQVGGQDGAGDGHAPGGVGNRRRGHAPGVGLGVRSGRDDAGGGEGLRRGAGAGWAAVGPITMVAWGSSAAGRARPQ